MSDWREQFDELITPAVARSAVTERLLIEAGAIAHTGVVTAGLTTSKRAVVFADQAGFGAAGERVCESLQSAGFVVDRLILESDPLPKASIEQSQIFIDKLQSDTNLFPIAVGSGVINDLVKYAAYQTDRRYISVATAASMDGYTSAGAPLARNGFKVTNPTRAPIALIADLDIISNAPKEMTGWGYGDLAGKSPAGGDWLLAELVGAESLDDVAWPLVQNHLRGWLSNPEKLNRNHADACAPLFIGLTAVGFAMEFHNSSRPASGADHQIAHLWEMEGLTYQGRKVSHGAAVSVGCVVTLCIYDWLLKQDLSAIQAQAPDLNQYLASMDALFDDQRIAERAVIETRAKWVDVETHGLRLARIREGWSETQAHIHRHLFRADDMMAMLKIAGAPSTPSEIGVSFHHLERTIRAAFYIRSRYTILDFLTETGLFEEALAAVIGRLRE